MHTKNILYSEKKVSNAHWFAQFASHLNSYSPLYVNR